MNKFEKMNLKNGLPGSQWNRLAEEISRKTYCDSDSVSEHNSSAKYENGTSPQIPPSLLSLCQSQCQTEANPKYKKGVYNCTLNPSNIITVHYSKLDEHCHNHELQQEIDKKARKKLWIASMLCLVVMIGEAVGGYLAGSLAIATDAAHLLTDFAGFMISLFALYISPKPATKRLNYGYHRAEVIGALTSVLLIWVITGILVYMAVERIVSGNYEIDARIMLTTSGIGLIVNIIMGWTLHEHEHSHGGGGGHDHSHSHSHENHSDIETSKNAHDSKERGTVNTNVRAAYIHVIGDFIQSVGVFAAAIVIYFRKDWIIVDPICTFLFSILVLSTTFFIIKDALVVLMEGIPQGIDFNEVREELLSVRGVYKVHNLRIWSLSMDRNAVSAHLAVDPNGGSTSNKTILRKASSLMRKKFGFNEITIQLEELNERMHDCGRCQELNP